MRSNLTSPAYQKCNQKLQQSGFERVERDDRLLDVFPTETREKGIELWQRWPARGVSQTVEIVRIILPYTDKKIYIYTLPRADVEHAFLSGKILKLETYKKDSFQTSSKESI